MNISEWALTVADVSVSVKQKDIKNLHISVLPPNGAVRVSAPLRLTEDNIRIAVASRIGWVKQRQREFAEQARESQRRYVDGENHFFNGRRYVLKTKLTDAETHVKLKRNHQLELRYNSLASRKTKEAAFDAFYRSALTDQVKEVAERWEQRLGVEASSIAIRRMRTRWGSCNPDTGAVILNLELAKKPKACLEYVLVHELVHLKERNHTKRFEELVRSCLPDWQSRRSLLNSYPLRYESWRF